MQCASKPCSHASVLHRLGPHGPALRRLSRQYTRHCHLVATRNAVKGEIKGKTTSGDEDSAFEQQLKSRRNKQKKTTVQDLQPNTLPTSSKPEAIPPNDQLEAVAVLVLVSLFIAIIGQGLFLAVSGFLPESWDQFAQDVVYKTFSPTLGIFLATSAGYGVWKSKQGSGK
ncbi:FRAS1- extracellular matrix protein 2 [Trebouxia sp. C0010 RCD-2024]